MRTGRRRRWEAEQLLALLALLHGAGAATLALVAPGEAPGAAAAAAPGTRMASAAPGTHVASAAPGTRVAAAAPGTRVAAATASTPATPQRQAAGRVGATTPASPPPGGGIAPASRLAFRLEGVATWRGDATAAYSLIHDDICDRATRGVFTVAVPELDRRGLHAGFGVIVSKCDAAGWATVHQLVAQGHDVFSHSWDHPCLTHDKELATSCDPKAPRSTDFEREIGRAAARLRVATGRPPAFFIFPYDVCDPAALAYLKAHDYLAARCGTPGINGADWVDPFAIQFDVYGPSYSRYFGVGPCASTAAGGKPEQYGTPPAGYSDACRRYVLDHYVDDALAAGGWAVRELHGLDPADPKGWETVAADDYRAHLDHVAALVAAHRLWVDGPTEVTRYRFAREPATCAPPQLVDGHVLRFAAPSAACRRWATLLSYRVATVDGSDAAQLAVVQGGQRRPARRVGPGRFVVDADPTGGDAVIVP